MNLDTVYKEAKKVPINQSPSFDSRSLLPCERNASSKIKEQSELSKLGSLLGLKEVQELDPSVLQIAKNGLPVFAAIDPFSSRVRLEKQGLSYWQNTGTYSFPSIGRRAHLSKEDKSFTAVAIGLFLAGITLFILSCTGLLPVLFAILLGITSIVMVAHSLDRLFGRPNCVIDLLEGRDRNYFYSFNGLIPDKTKKTIHKLQSKGFRTVLICEAEWIEEPKSLDPLLCVIVNDKFYIVDKFDLTSTEEYLASEFATSKEIQ